MIDLAVYNREGQEVDKLKVAESDFGGSVRYSLLKQALVMQHANKRVGTAATRGRGMKAGSGRKLFRQKGTGNARVGNSRTGKRVGGGVTFAKSPKSFRKRMPKKQKRLAVKSAILSKLLGNDIIVVDELNFEKPRTHDFVEVLGNLSVDRGCLVAISDYNESIYKSSRNVPRVAVMPVANLNAFDICRRKKMIFTKEAFLSFLNKSKADKN